MYNGYKNYATWSIFNFISNNEESYNHYQSIYKDLLEGGQETAIEGLAETLRADINANEVIDPNERDINQLYNDILADALSDVDYMEVASAFTE